MRNRLRQLFWYYVVRPKLFKALENSKIHNAYLPNADNFVRELRKRTSLQYPLESESRHVDYDVTSGKYRDRKTHKVVDAPSGFMGGA